MTKKGYKQTEEHKRNTGRAVTGKKNGMWKESVPFVCPVCGLTKYYKSSELKNKKSCSKKCASSGKNNKMYGKFGKDNPNYKERVLFKCQTCGKIEYITQNAARAKKFCSPECQYAAGQSKEMIMKVSGENSKSWKGDDVGYRGVHHWVIQLKGPAKNYKCVDCDKRARDWSNVDHLYKRNVNDYLPRCTSCHRKYDIKMSKN